MQNKQIVFTAPGKAELLEIPMPKPGAGQVLVRLEFSTISSGTERANVSGNPNVSIAPDTGEPAKFPRYSGYSSAGTIEAVGEGVTSLKPGDRVALIWSTHSHFQTTTPNKLFLLPESVSLSSGALCNIASFSMAAIRKTRFELGEAALVMGLGVLGLIAVRLYRCAGAVPVIATDPDETRREKALKFGADFALDPFASGFADIVKHLTRGGCKSVVEVTGNGKALDQALDCMARFGRMALLGCTRNSDFKIDYYRKVHGPGITLIGAHTLARPSNDSASGWWTQRDDIEALLNLMHLSRFTLDDIVEDTRSPYEASEVYTNLASDRSFPVTQFEWGRLDE